MKLTSVFILAACLTASAAGTAQTVTLNEKNASLEKVFKEINRQTGYNFLYNSKTLKDAKHVSINVKDAPLNEALQICFAQQPLDFVIEDNTIVVKGKAPTAADNLQLNNMPPPINVHGRVTNEDGDPIQGVSVTVKGTDRGTVTDVDGEFSISNLDEHAILVFTAINIETSEINLNGKKEIALVTKTKVSKLDEMQIIAYGKTNKRFQTGNVITIKASDIQNQPVSNPLLALQGRVPGLVISQATGYTGSGVSINIQGQNSIERGNMPFYVIDGVPYISELPPNFGEILGASQSGASGNYGPPTSGNPLSYLNPQDIESIEVLKDADATAIYGSRAANGAILITTRKGKIGRTSVELNIQSGFGEVSRELKMLSTKQYLELRREAYKNDGLPVPTSGNSTRTADLVYYDQNRDVDWQKVLIGGKAKYRDLQMNIGGGNTQLQYLVGMNYHKETTVLPFDRGSQTASSHFSINSSSANNKFRFSISGNYMFSQKDLPITDLTAIALSLAPNAPQLFNADGSLNWALMNNGRTSWVGSHPLSRREEIYNDHTGNLIANANISYELIKGLTLRSNFGYTNMQTDEFKALKSTGLQPAFRGLIDLTADYGNNNLSSWIIEPQLTYSRAIKLGRLEVLAGTTFQQNSTSRRMVEGKGYSNDLQLEDINAALTITAPPGTSLLNRYKYQAAFGRINYNLFDKYIFNISGRRDGTSRFGQENRFHNFGAVGAAWLFSNENFIKNNFSFLSFGKLKASYGTTGSDQIGDYQYLSLYNSISYPVSYGGGSGLMPTGLPNPYLQWEEVKKLSATVELGLIKDRFLITGTYFRNRSSNQLLTEGLPMSTGFSTITNNMASAVQNSGWEVLLNSENIKDGQFKWSTAFNFSIPKNKLLTGYAKPGYQVGKPITFQRVFKYSGVDPNTGIYQFADSNGKLLTQPTDRWYTINTAPTLYGGLQNSLSYKNFSFDFFFQFAKQKGQAFALNDPPGSNNVNAPEYTVSHWQKAGDVSQVQKLTVNDFNVIINQQAYVNSDATWADASYIRLKNAALSYSLPGVILNKIRMQSAKIYVHGENLLTFTRFFGLDPEARNSRSLPPLRVITFGIQVTL